MFSEYIAEKITGIIPLRFLEVFQYLLLQWLNVLFLVAVAILSVLAALLFLLFAV